MVNRLKQQRRRLEQLAKRRPMTDPTYYFQAKRQLLDHQSDRLVHAMERSLSGKRQNTARLAAALDAMSPLKVLGRGYAIARKEDGTLLTRRADAVPGERFELRVSDGSIACRVDDV
jgi:exodeoxyribonuclease VII large subunit